MFGERLKQPVNYAGLALIVLGLFMLRNGWEIGKAMVLIFATNKGKVLRSVYPYKHNLFRKIDL
jgi:hypothetical protein